MNLKSLLNTNVIMYARDISKNEQKKDAKTKNLTWIREFLQWKNKGQNKNQNKKPRTQNIISTYHTLNLSYK